MVNKAKAPNDLVASWAAILARASDAQRKKEEEHDRATEFRDVCVRDAFDAGLTVDPISDATGLSVGRLYQIKRGVRR
jgi:hypothetical protein